MNNFDERMSWWCFFCFGHKACLWINVLLGFIIVGCSSNNEGEKEASLLEVSPINITLDDNDEGNFYIKSNTLWTINTDVDWITLSHVSGKDSQQVKIRATSKNKSQQERKAIIEICDSKRTIVRNVNVHQKGNVFLTVEPKDLHFASSNSTKTFNISTNMEWTVKSNATWCTISKGSGRNDASINVSVSENNSTTSRNTSVIITSGISPVTINIEQSGKGEELVIDKTSIDKVPAIGGNYSVSVTSNLTWTVNSSQSWCTVSPTSGNNNGSVEIKVKANNEKTEREAMVTVKGGSITRTITVKQVGYEESSYLDVDKTEIVFTEAEGNNAFSINSNVSWTISGGTSWCTVNPSKGSGSKTVAVIVTENTSVDERSAELIVTGGSVSKKVNIRQSAANPEISVSPNSLSFSPSSDSKTVSVKSNMKWTASSSDSWCAISPTSGSSGTTTVTLKVTANTTSSTRDADITIKAGNITRIISVTQSQPSTLTLGDQSISFEGTSSSKSVSLSSNTSWTISSNQTWLSCSPSQGSNSAAITISVSENTSTSRRSGTITAKTTDGSISRSISVYQDPSPYISVSSTSLSVDCAKQSKSFTISSNTSWIVSDDASWISCSPENGSNGGTINVEISENTGSERTGTITVKSKDGTITRTISVKQGKYVYIEVSPTTIYASKSGGTYTISVESNTTWYAFKGMANYGSSWINLSPTKGSGNGKVTVKASANSNSSAWATVVISTVSGLQNSTSKVVTITH